MSEIDPRMFAEVVAEVAAEIESQTGEISTNAGISTEELFWRLVAKGYQPLPEVLAKARAARH